MDNTQLQVGHYRMSKTLGIGAFGKVKLGEHVITGNKVGNADPFLHLFALCEAWPVFNKSCFPSLASLRLLSKSSIGIGSDSWIWGKR